MAEARRVPRWPRERRGVLTSGASEPVVGWQIDRVAGDREVPEPARAGTAVPRPREAQRSRVPVGRSLRARGITRVVDGRARSDGLERSPPRPGDRLHPRARSHAAGRPRSRLVGEFLLATVDHIGASRRGLTGRDGQRKRDGADDGGFAGPHRWRDATPAQSSADPHRDPLRDGCRQLEGALTSEHSRLSALGDTDRSGLSRAALHLVFRRAGLAGGASSDGQRVRLRVRVVQPVAARPGCARLGFRLSAEMGAWRGVHSC